MKAAIRQRAARQPLLVVACGVLLLLTPQGLSAQPSRPGPPLVWQVVVNNGVTVPGDPRRFNSYNQPSVNVDGLVVFRARSKGGMAGEPAHGVYTRDMSVATAVTSIFNRTTLVPYPNNLGTTITEPPSFPRIDQWSQTMASRGNHPPSWKYQLPDGSESRAGTTGIYTNPFGTLSTGASNLGATPGFEFFGIPDHSALKFDVFPGAPAISDTNTLVFKGNYTLAGVAHTGVYYRELANSPAGGGRAIVPIADTTTLIPGTTTRFGSTAPPSASERIAVFAGFDNEEAPTLGGIYLARMTGPYPRLTALVRIGQQVPDEKKGIVFNRLGEGVSFDGRFVAFWGAWGDEMTALVLQCRDEGNKERVAFCRQQYPDGYHTTVPLHQGMFVHDTKLDNTIAVAKAPADYDDFVYWNFSGLVPGTGSSDDAGEPARWRSASFVAVSGLVDDRLMDPFFHVAFKARTGHVMNGAFVAPVDGIYLRKGPRPITLTTVIESGMDGTLLDPDAVDALTHAPLPVTEMGLERDGFRGRWLAINASMGTEEAGWAGIYLASIPQR